MATTNSTINAGGISRPMTADELAAYTQTVTDMQQEAAAQEQAAAERQVAREALLTKLGITEQEAQLLLGS
jgi:hypothetical protein